MMKQYRHNPFIQGKAVGWLMLLMLSGFMLSFSVQANTGAGAKILNVVQVTWQDASGTTSYAETDFAEVTVNLVPSAPTLSAPTNQTVASGANATYNYTITATANGSDSYALTDAETLTALASSGTTISATPITLGATVVLTVNDGTDTITVPSGSEVDIVNGDTVMINGVLCTVATVNGGAQASHLNPSGTDGAAGTTTGETTASISCSNTPDLSTVVAGSLVAERVSFTLTVTGVVSGSSDGTDSVVLTATAQGTGNPASSDTTLTTFQAAALTINKEVSTDGGATFAATANADPGATLTYRITVDNTGAGNATVVEIVDALADYTTYTAGSAKLDTTAAVVTYAAAATSLTDAAGGDNYDFAITTANTATLAHGTLAGGAKLQLFYNVTID